MSLSKGVMMVSHFPVRYQRRGHKAKTFGSKIALELKVGCFRDFWCKAKTGTEIMKEQSRPAWVETLSGSHPALSAKLTPEEEAFIEKRRLEAEAAMNSARPDLWQEDTRFVADCERRIKVARTSLEVFEDKQNTVENRAERIREQRLILATALYQSGRYDEAASVLLTSGGNPKKGCKSLLDHIALIAQADAIDDSLEHNCEREVVEGEKTTLILNRRHIAEQVVSRKNQQVEWLWRCDRCGAFNLSPEVPERQKEYEALRREAYESVAAQGRKLHKSAGLGAKVGLPVQMSDDHLLKS